MKYYIGDKVRFLNDVGGGVISAFIDDNTVQIAIDDGFDVPVKISEIIKIPGENIEREEKEAVIKEEVVVLPEKIKEVVREIQEDVFVEKNVIQKHLTGKKMAVVDMHIWDLVENHSGLSKQRIFEIQMDYFVRCLDSAIACHLSKVVFIHGVGSGVLRKEIRDKMDYNYSFVEYMDGSMADFGIGATEVHIPHNV